MGEELKLDRMQKLITEEQKKEEEEALRKKQQGRVAATGGPERRYEHSDVDSIVARMKQRYEQRGIGDEGEQPTKAEELKEMVSGTQARALDQRLPVELAASKKPFIRFVGGMYKRLPVLNRVVNRIAGYGIAKSLPFKLDSANMSYSTKQYVGVCVVAALLASVFAFPLAFALIHVVFGSDVSLWAALQLSPTGALGSLGLASYSFAAAIVAELALAGVAAAALWLVALLVALSWPSSTASRRGVDIDRNLPFALRHMATEVRAGVGIHKTMASIVSADYGVLSEEFERTLNDIEKGVSTEDALDSMAQRSPSESLSRAMSHVIRALKTGGNLSEIIEVIAKDVSFELRMKMRDFVERLNLVGLFYMMIGIVFPVFVAVLAGIFNAIPTLGMAGMMGTEMLFLIYFVLIPMMLSLILYIVKVMQPM